MTEVYYFYNDCNPPKLGTITKVKSNNTYLFKEKATNKEYPIPFNSILKLESDKGVYGKNCNRVSCQESPATFLNKVTGAYYCLECKMKIQEGTGTSIFDY